MKATLRYLAPLLLVLVLCASVALAQDEEIAEYVTPFRVFPQIIQTMIWSVIYLAIYAAALVIPLAYLRLYNGYDTEMLYWIGAVWVGGMAINAVAYKIVHISFIAALLAVPLIFAWTVFITTRPFVDQTLDAAKRIALVVAIVCAPWFGPTWRIQPPSKESPLESHITVPAVQTPLATVTSWDGVGASSIDS